MVDLVTVEWATVVLGLAMVVMEAIVATEDTEDMVRFLIIQYTFKVYIWDIRKSDIFMEQIVLTLDSLHLPYCVRDIA